MLLTARGSHNLISRVEVATRHWSLFDLLIMTTKGSWHEIIFGTFAFTLESVRKARTRENDISFDFIPVFPNIDSFHDTGHILYQSDQTTLTISNLSNDVLFSPAFCCTGITRIIALSAYHFPSQVIDHHICHDCPSVATALCCLANPFCTIITSIFTT